MSEHRSVEEIVEDMAENGQGVIRDAAQYALAIAEMYRRRMREHLRFRSALMLIRSRRPQMKRIAMLHLRSVAHKYSMNSVMHVFGTNRGIVLTAKER